MHNAITSVSPTSRRRFATGIIATAAGALLGVLASTTAIDRHASAQTVTSLNAARWGSPGRVTMSADAIEQWIADLNQASAQTRSSHDPSDPAQWGSPGHVTMSADAIEQWIARRLEGSTTASPPRTADAAEQWLTPG